jgi:hypothetical protein
MMIQDAVVLPVTNRPCSLCRTQIATKTCRPSKTVVTLCGACYDLCVANIVGSIRMARQIKTTTTKEGN